MWRSGWYAFRAPNRRFHYTAAMTGSGSRKKYAASSPAATSAALLVVCRAVGVYLGVFHRLGPRFLDGALVDVDESGGT